MTRRGKIIALGIVLVIGVPVSLPFVWRYQGQRELRRTLESLKARGEKLTIAELTPPRPPEEENGFPALRGLASRLTSVNSPVSRFTGPGKLVVVTSITSWTNYTAETMDTWDDVAAWLERDRPILTEARGVLKKPTFHAGRNYSQGFNLLIPDLSQWKKLAVGFKLAALQEARVGNRREALENLRAGLRVGSVLRDDPLLISQLVRIACDIIMFDTVWHCMHTLDWTEVELAEMQAMLPPHGHMDGMVRGLEMEGVMGRSLASAIREGRVDMTAYLSGGTGSSGPTNLTEFMDMAIKQPGELFLTRPMAEFWRFAHLDASEAHYLSALQRMIDNTRLAATKKSMAELDRDFTERMRLAMGASERFRYLLSYMVLPALEKVSLKGLKAETHRGLTEAALALHRYHRRNGQWPDALNALVPEYLPAVPIDYSDGQPLRYRKKPDGTFLLYSIGESKSLEPDDSTASNDLSLSEVLTSPPPAKRAVPVDEGGDPTPYQTNRVFNQMWSGRDAVWPQPATKEEIEAYEARRRKMAEDDP